MEEALAVTTFEIAPDITSLEQGVADLWKHAREQRPGETLTRALTLNLIAVTDRKRQPDLRAAIDRLLLRHPCRLFLVIIDSQQQDITAKLSAEIQELRNCIQMVLERLTLTAKPSDFQKLPGLIRPLLVNDIPVHLFWAMPLPADLSHVAALSQMADRMIMDSTLFAEGDWHRLQLAESLAPTDLAWLRLEPWRRALAEAFEQFEWQPETPTRVTIQHSNEQGSRATAHKLRAWLRSKLGAEVSLVRIKERCPTNEPLGIQLQHGPADLRVRHLCDEPRLEAQLSLDDRCLLPFRIPAAADNRGDLLAAAIDR